MKAEQPHVRVTSYIPLDQVSVITPDPASESLYLTMRDGSVLSATARDLVKARSLLK